MSDKAAARMVRWARRRSGMTQHDLARAAGVPQPAIARVETGRVNPRVDTLIAWLRATGHELSIEALLGARVDRSELRARMRMVSVERVRLAVGATWLTPILRRLRRHGVRFVLIGDVAEAAHGAPAHASNVEIVPRREQENLERLAAARRELGNSSNLLEVVRWDGVDANAVPMRVDTGLLVRVAALDDLLRIRRARDRPEDRDALEVLGALRDELDGAGRLEGTSRPRA